MSGQTFEPSNTIAFHVYAIVSIRAEYGHGSYKTTKYVEPFSGCDSLGDFDVWPIFLEEHHAAAFYESLEPWDKFGKAVKPVTLLAVRGTEIHVLKDEKTDSPES